MGGEQTEESGRWQTGETSCRLSNRDSLVPDSIHSNGGAQTAISSVSGMASSPATFFAPAGRDSEPELRRKQELIHNVSLFQAMMDAIPRMVLVLNTHRQVLAANAALRKTLDVPDLSVLGRRPGELFGCIHCSQGPDGCGTARECETCGAVSAVLASQNHGRQATQECRLTVSSSAGDQALDLRVTATPVAISGERFTFVDIADISHEKRLAVLMRTFFHDVINTVGGIHGIAQLLAQQCDVNPDDQECLQQLGELAEQLVEEVESHRDLTYAESGDLATRFEPVATRQLLENLRSLYSRHEVAMSRTIALGDLWDGQIVTDRRLLARVLGNMVKNALEAVRPGGVVTLHCRQQDDRVTFAVHNSGEIPQHVQYQIFQRSFTTKGQVGRGIGTHSMKLLGERYLRGRVEFSSSESAGTTFTITLPREAT